MLRVNCHRKGCTRIRSEFSLFLSRHQPPRFEGKSFCGETCLRDYIESEMIERWRRLQQVRIRAIRRPRLGSILLQTAFVTPKQLDTAIQMQRVNREGRLGEWLLRLGFVEEQQITLALSKQYALPVIHLAASDARPDAARLVPGKVARCARLAPLGLDEEKKSLCIAVSAPVDFNSIEAIRRMVGIGLITYICDQSAVLPLLARLYEPEELDLTGTPAYSSQSEFLDICRTIVSSALIQRAENMQMELAEEFLWARLDFPGRSAQQVYRREPASVDVRAQFLEPQLAVASMGSH